MTEAVVGEKSPTSVLDMDITPLPFPEVNAKWRLQAKCREKDSSMWFASKPKGINNSSAGGKTVKSRRKRAQKICNTCPVQYECLRYAILNKFRDGIWAGYEMDELTPTDRQVLLQRVKRTERKLSKTVNK